MALIICYECGHKVSDKAAACPHCGAPVIKQPPEEPKKICEECGESVPAKDKTCPNCGYPFDEAESSDTYAAAAKLESVSVSASEPVPAQKPINIPTPSPETVSTPVPQSESLPESATASEPAQESAPSNAESTTKFCSKCGSPMKKNAKFCNKCGMAIQYGFTSVVSSQKETEQPAYQDTVVLEQEDSAELCWGKWMCHKCKSLNSKDDMFCTKCMTNRIRY